MDTNREQTTTQGNALTVLVVDNDLDTAESLSDLLRLYGYYAESVSSSVDAIERVNQIQPDVIFLDIRMPEINGWELARQWSHQEKQPVLIAISGMCAEDDHEHSRRAGIQLHLNKPVEPELILEVLRKISCSRSSGELIPNGSTLVDV